MDIRINLQFSLSLSKDSKMAIAFFVDPEYGPLLPTTNNTTQQSQNNNNNNNQGSRSRVIPDTTPAPTRNNRRQVNVEIDENNNHVIPDLIHGVANFPGFLPPTVEENQEGQGSTRRHSFVTQLSMDWLSIERLLSCFFSRSPARVTSDESSRGVSGDDELPDLVQCHNGFSIDVSFESSRVFGSQHRTPTPITSDNVNDTPRRRCRHPAGGFPSSHRRSPVSLLPNNNQDPSDVAEVEDEWDMELKVAVNSWKQVGEDLRRIGDQFAFEFESSIQRSERRESFQVRCVLRLATLPTLALVGLVTGVAYLRRHL